MPTWCRRVAPDERGAVPEKCGRVAPSEMPSWCGRVTPDEAQKTAGAQRLTEILRPRRRGIRTPRTRRAREAREEGVRAGRRPSADTSEASGRADASEASGRRVAPPARSAARTT